MRFVLFFTPLRGPNKYVEFWQFFHQTDKCFHYFFNLWQLKRIGMEENSKSHYEVPSTTVMEVRTEGFVCASGGTESYNRNTEQDW